MNSQNNKRNINKLANVLSAKTQKIHPHIIVIVTGYKPQSLYPNGFAAFLFPAALSLRFNFLILVFCRTPIFKIGFKIFFDLVNVQL